MPAARYAVILTLLPIFPVALGEVATLDPAVSISVSEGRAACLCVVADCTDWWFMA
jgi:hypothetical protein